MSAARRWLVTTGASVLVLGAPGMADAQEGAAVGSPGAKGGGSRATVALGPFAKGVASQAGGRVDVGIEAYPTSGELSWGGRIVLSASEGDPTSGPAQLTSNAGTLGAKGQFIVEAGPGFRTGTNIGEVSISRFGLLLQPEVHFAQYTYAPDGGPSISEYFTSWSGELHAWWFGSAGPAKAVGSHVDTSPLGGIVTDYSAWLMQPQLIATFARAYEQAPLSYVVQPPQRGGPQLAQAERISAPTVMPEMTLRAAFPFEPPIGRFAYAPVVALSTVGSASSWDPTGVAGRLRLEVWLYYFAFDAGQSAVRIGIAPFVDARTGGTDELESVVAGGLFEMRTSVSRLEY